MPLAETATNTPLPYVTERQELSTGVVLDVQDSPAVNDETRTSKTDAVAGATATPQTKTNATKTLEKPALKTRIGMTIPLRTSNA